MRSDNETAEALPFSDDAARWAAVLARDPAADRVFRYAVRSTGIYCRPSCSARRPSRANVAFFPGAAEAEAAGFAPADAAARTARARERRWRIGLPQPAG